MGCGLWDVGGRETHHEGARSMKERESETTKYACLRQGFGGHACLRQGFGGHAKGERNNSPQRSQGTQRKKVLAEWLGRERISTTKNTKNRRSRRMSWNAKNGEGNHGFHGWERDFVRVAIISVTQEL